MTETYREVTTEDFLTFSREKPPHLLIEAALLEIGGGGNRGVEYKQRALKNAGWKYHALTSYGAHAEVAALAFNNIRMVLQKTQDPQEILDQLSALQAD